MAKKIYVGNLPFTASEQDIHELFGQYGEVQSVTLPTERDSGRPRGFGFVEMAEQAATEAIRALDGTEFGGRNLRVSEAKAREQGRPRQRRR